MYIHSKNVFLVHVAQKLQIFAKALSALSLKLFFMNIKDVENSLFYNNILIIKAINSEHIHFGF